MKVFCEQIFFISYCIVFLSSIFLSFTSWPFTSWQVFKDSSSFNRRTAYKVWLVCDEKREKQTIYPDDLLSFRVYMSLLQKNHIALSNILERISKQSIKFKKCPEGLLELEAIRFRMQGSELFFDSEIIRKFP